MLDGCACFLDGASTLGDHAGSGDGGALQRRGVLARGSLGAALIAQRGGGALALGRGMFAVRDGVFAVRGSVLATGGGVRLRPRRVLMRRRRAE